MWDKLVAGYRSWEEEQIAILANPEVAERLPPGMRKFFGMRLANMSPIERRQLLEFSLVYRGRRLGIVLAKLIVLFTTVGVAAHLAIPRISVLQGILICNLLGIVLVSGSYIAYFNYRQLAGKRMVIALALFVASTFGGYLMGAKASAAEKGLTLSAVIEKSWTRVVWIGGGVCLIMVLPIAVIGVVRNRQYHHLTAQLERDAERERSARELSESRLRLLHAQIEPHFLFNTLGAVQQLAEAGAPKAAALTAHLIDFLRASMNEMRNETVPLKADFAMIDAYLQVMQARMGERLRFTLSLPEHLEQVEVPSMLLLTLVENAIKHGMEPALRGGEIHVIATESDSRLRLAVHDSGVGLPLDQSKGAGEGLSNVRSRLLLKYGTRAGLNIANGPEQGAIAEIIIPMNEQQSR